jgi:membrane-associated phospholipid phosphatase
MLNILDNTTQIINNIGCYGPLLLFFQSIYFLQKKPNYMIYYITGFFIDGFINILLKGIIKQPRPYIDKDMHNLSLTYLRRFMFKDGILFDIYGMPSGHSQSVMFSTTFIWLVLKNKFIFIVYLFVSLITFYQRIESNMHTLTQVFIGAFVGILMGSLFYYLGQKNLIGNLKEKVDDFAFN